MKTRAVVALLLVSGCSSGERSQGDNVLELERKAEAAQAFQSDPHQGLNPAVRAAPKGFPQAISLAAIKRIDKGCGEVTFALRMPDDGTIEAQCKGGGAYRVFTDADSGKVDAVKCEPTGSETIDGACK